MEKDDKLAVWYQKGQSSSDKWVIKRWYVHLDSFMISLGLFGCWGLLSRHPEKKERGERESKRVLVMTILVLSFSERGKWGRNLTLNSLVLVWLFWGSCCWVSTTPVLVSSGRGISDKRNKRKWLVCHQGLESLDGRVHVGVTAIVG